ncbi:MAG: hypothetical protein LBS96_05170 [Oscillospiraceae bacterium]|nr:hypothetical protein [Oscillospiraceae bacterium]
MKKPSMRAVRRALCLFLAAALLCLGLTGCNQRAQEFTVRSTWGNGSLTLRLAAEKPQPNEAGTRVEFQSNLGLDEIADAIAEQLPANATMERPGGSILLRVTNGEGALAQTDFYYLSVSEMQSVQVVQNDDGQYQPVTEKPDRKGARYLLSCLEAEFASPEGTVQFLFPSFFLGNFNQRMQTEALPMDTPMKFNEIGYQALLQFYEDFGRYNFRMVNGVVVISGYKNLPEGVDEFLLPPMGQRVYLKVDGLARDYTIQVSLTPGIVEPETQTTGQG